MNSADFDIITIGGGIGGSTLAKVMAERGARVLVLESETKFRDRVRGEIMPSWGVAEAQELGVYDVMKAAGAWEYEWEERRMKWSKGKADDLFGQRHLPSSTVPGTPKLNFVIRICRKLCWRQRPTLVQ